MVRFKNGDLVRWAAPDDENKNLRTGDMGIIVRQEEDLPRRLGRGLVVQWFTSDGGFGNSPERWFVAIIGDRLEKVDEPE